MATALSSHEKELCEKGLRNEGAVRRRGLTGARRVPMDETGGAAHGEDELSQLRLELAHALRGREEDQL